MLGPDNDGAPAHPLVVEGGELLQRPGGEHPGRPVAGHQSGSARPFPYTGGQHHSPRRDRLGSLGARGCHHPTGEGLHGAADLELHPRPLGQAHKMGRVAGAGGDPVAVADRVAPVRRVAGRAARLELAFVDHHPTRTPTAQLGSGGQAGRAGTDDDDVGGGHVTPIQSLIGRSVNAAAWAQTSAEQ